jgi:two-component system cell cycle response regulator DivK
MTHILLVEDNQMNRDMLSRWLRRKGYEVTTANDGVEGVEQARIFRPDLILLDMSLPLKDGWTAAAELKADVETANIPIIALTAHAMQGDREKALDAGCDDYDTKPVEFERLLEKMQRLLSQEK